MSRKSNLIISLFVIYMTTSAVVQHARASENNKIIVLVPGLMGSKLCNASGDVVWGDRFSYMASRIAALRLPPNVEDRDKSIHSCGLIENLNIIPLLWESNVYRSLLTFLRTLGYKDENIVTFDYDWRLSNFHNADLLRKRVDELGQSQVDIISHSMGGIISRIYYQSLSGSQKVHSLVMIGTPHFGSASIFARLENGFDSWPNILSGGIEEVQTTIMSFPSFYEILPTYDQCCGFVTARKGEFEYVDILDPRTWKRIHIPTEFKSGTYASAVAEYLKAAASLKKLMRAPITTDPQAWSRLHFIANGFVDTWSRVFFDAVTGKVAGHTSEAGDGTVLLFSATNGVPAQVQISLQEHPTLFDGKAPELVINAAVSGRRWTNGNQEYEQTILDYNNRSFVLQGASITAIPETTTPAQNLLVTIKLRGNEVRDANLSNLKVALIDDEGETTLPVTEDIFENGVRLLKTAFRAPTALGAYKVQLSVPGLQKMSASFAVLAP